jgi:hypothetical protein
VTLYFRHGRDRARLKGGVLLTVDQGGCDEDYYNSYAFTVPGDTTPLSDRDYWNRKAAALLREVAPANRDKTIPLAPLIRDLERQGGDVIDERALEEAVRYSVEFARRGGPARSSPRRRPPAPARAPVSGPAPRPGRAPRLQAARPCP